MLLAWLVMLFRVVIEVEVLNMKRVRRLAAGLDVMGTADPAAGLFVSRCGRSGGEADAATGTIACERVAALRSNLPSPAGAARACLAR